MDLRNKTALFLGSSVTFGFASDGVSFVDFIEQATGARCIKEAVSGTTLADIGEQSYVSRLKKVSTDTPVDLFVCQLSANDAALKIDIGLTEAAIREVLDYVRKTFGCPIVFYTIARFENAEYEILIDLLYKMKEEYNFEVLDLFNDEEMRSVSDKDHCRYMKDSVHPTLLGYQEWWTPKFLAFFEKLC